MAPRDGLFAAAPRILRCAADRRRGAPASNSAFGQVVEPVLLSVGGSNRNDVYQETGEGLSSLQKYGSPGRITRRCAPRPSGAALRALSVFLVSFAHISEGTLIRFSLPNGSPGRMTLRPSRRVAGRFGLFRWVGNFATHQIYQYLFMLVPAEKYVPKGRSVA
jgi:hypothetical protein